jgi:uncharacterized protein YigA (DUF484 family)
MKSEERKPEIESDGERETEIANYLAAHPEFFERHLELLLALRLPHRTGGAAVSLLERQLDALRSEVKRYRSQLEEFIAVARDNESLHRRMHRLTLALLEPGELDDIQSALRAELQSQFEADAVELRLFGPELGTAPDPDPTLAAFRRLLDQGRPVCGALEPGQMEQLFGDQARDLSSAALIPLKGQNVLGLLAVSSRDPDRFHPGKGTEFLVRLGELASRRLEVALRGGD